MEIGGWKQMVIKALALLIPVLVYIAAWNYVNWGSSDSHEIKIYYSESCGCCKAYIKELEDLQEARITAVQNFTEWKEVRSRYRIPRKYMGCHSMLVDGRHFVEGHLPIAVVRSLFRMEEPLVISNPNHVNLAKYYILAGGVAVECGGGEDPGRCLRGRGEGQP